MGCAVAQGFCKEKYEKPNLDTAAVPEDYAVWPRIVSYWAIGTKVGKNSTVVKVPRVAIKQRVMMEVSQHCFVQTQ